MLYSPFKKRASGYRVLSQISRTCQLPYNCIGNVAGIGRRHNEVIEQRGDDQGFARGSLDVAGKGRHGVQRTRFALKLDVREARGERAHAWPSHGLGPKVSPGLPLGPSQDLADSDR